MADSGKKTEIRVQRSEVGEQDWAFLLNTTILYASEQVHGRHWRGSQRGVLPGGFDPNSLAAEAIAEFLQQHAQKDGFGNMPVEAIQQDLEGRVRNHVSRLYLRSENSLLRSEIELANATLDDGERIGIIELIPDLAGGAETERGQRTAEGGQWERGQRSEVRAQTKHRNIDARKRQPAFLICLPYARLIAPRSLTFKKSRFNRSPRG